MRYLRLKLRIEALLDTHEIDAIGLEEVRRHAGTTAAHIYGGVVAVLTMICEERQIPWISIPVKTIKKTATGNGNASKDKMIAAANEKWNIEVGDDNEADALWCAHCLEDHLDNV